MIRFVESVILLEVPEAEALVRELRLEGDPSAALGVPAHVTLLYPFVAEPDEGVVEELRFFFAGVDGFPVEFSSVGEFPEVVYLAPDQPDVVSGLIGALARRWPAYPPFGGAFDEVVPHLTVVNTPDSALRARARAAVEPGLPVRSVAREASLWVRREGSPWYRLARFPLGPVEP
ncbi:MAG: 2'-5' RNA ligase family protein [Mycobacteriales bacterium]